jgi:hypothetical protein
MPKATKIPGLTDYGDDDNAPPKQAVYPKSQGGQATSSAPKETKIPGLKDYGGDSVSVKRDDSQGDGTWSGLWHDIIHPQAANLDRPQTWRDWATKTYSPSVSDVGRAALDDVSFGTADYARSKLTGENIADLRARTADAQAAMGPMGPVVNALTYVVPGAGVAKGLEAAGAAGKVAGALGRYGAGALEGAAANATSSVGHQAGGYIDPLKVAKDTATGAVFGVGGQAVGDLAASAVRNVSNYVRGSPGRGGEQWDWRTRAASGDPTVQSDVAISRETLPSDHPAQPALAKTQAALNQSIEPGRMADAIYGTTGAIGGYMGVPPDYALLGGVGGLTAGGVTKQMFGTPGARAINTLDRNINVGQSLDQLYPALYGPHTTPALDTSGWANVLRQGAIGGERPVDQDRDAQFW